MANALNWFEIPAADFDRAKKFYESVLGIVITEISFPNGRYGTLPADAENGSVGGGLMQSDGFNPSKDGALIYLNAMPDLSVGLAKIEAAGGKVIMPKTSIGPNGFMAHFIDTEGNRMALHSMK